MMYPMKKKDFTAYKRIIRQWHDTHLNEYNDFIKMVDAALENGDITVFEKNFNILENALPKGVTDYFSIKENNPFLWDSKEYTPGRLWDACIKMQEDMFQYTPGFIKKLKEQRIKSNDPQMFSMYYWLYFEGGAKKIKTIYTKYLVPEECGVLKKYFYDVCIGLLVSKSIQYFMNSKKDWIAENQVETDEDAKMVVKKTLGQVEGVNQGKSDVDLDLEQMLNGNTEKLIEIIGLYVRNRKHNSHIGYIFYFLQETDCIEKNKYNYATFHRAIIRKFPDAGISGYDSAQELYRKIQSLKNASPRLLNEYDRMKKKMWVAFIEANH